MSKPTGERLAQQLENPRGLPGNVGHDSAAAPENGPHFEDHGDDHTHHVPMSQYYQVFGFLMFMLFVTVGAWWIDQGPFPLKWASAPIAVGIALAKATAIVLIFMHVKFSSRLVQILACTGVVFVSIMFLLTFNDYFSRPSTSGWDIGIVRQLP